MEAKLPDNCQLSLVSWQLFFLRIPAKRIERFFGSFNDKMHEAGFGMTEISFFLKKIYLICKKTEIDRIINGKSGERMGYRRFSNRLNKRIKIEKVLEKRTGIIGKIKRGCPKSIWHPRFIRIPIGD